jgi:acyl carrier protein
MAADARGLPSAIVTAGMDADVAVAAFRLCLAAVPLSQVVVSTLPPGELLHAVAAAAIPAAAMLDADIAPQSVSSVTPETSLERDVAAIWEEVLGVTGIGLHDDFFKLGGHSVLALQIVQRCRDRLNFAITVQQLFTIRTVAGLVQARLSTVNQEETTRITGTEEATQDGLSASFPGLDSSKLDQLAASWRDAPGKKPVTSRPMDAL